MNFSKLCLLFLFFIHAEASRYEEAHRPCFFNALCSCSSASPDLGSVTCYDVPFVTIPRELKHSAIYIVHFRNNNLKTIDENSLNGTGLWKLQVNQNLLTNLPQKAFAGLEKTLSILDLSDNKIVKIPRLAISRLEKLQSLNLAGNLISTVLTDDIFQLGKTLKHLDLSGNALSYIHNDALRNMESLETLNLATNSLISVNDIFIHNGFYSLKSINLMDNQLRQVPLTALANLPKIKVVNLSNNLISSMSDDNGIHRRVVMEEINLENNLLHEIPSNSFKHFFSIDKIRLKGNPLKAVNDSAFIGTNAIEIDMSDCMLSEVSPEAFAGLENSLQVLDLSFNNLTDFPQMYLNKLVSLNLRGNKIKAIQPESISRIGKSLKYLDISGEEMGPFPENILRNVPHVRHLNFKRTENGRLTEHDFEEVKQTLEDLYLTRNYIHVVESGAFSHLSSLRLLDLSHNKIKEIENDSFRDVAHSLEKLILHNALSLAEFPARAFKPLSKLLYLDVSVNKLSGFPHDSFASLERLQHVNLNHNSIKEIGPWFINKRNNPEIHNIKLSFNKITLLATNTFNNLKKLTRVDLRDNFIKEIKSSAFVDLDSVVSINLEANCIETIENEAFQNLPNVQIINFARNRLKNFNLEAFDQVGRLSALKIDVKRNLIQELSRNFTSGPKSSNIKAITFSQNNISRLDWGYFHPVRHSLVSLDLSENSIQNITDGALENMEHLQVLNIAYNEISEISEGAFNRLSHLQLLNSSHNNLSSLPSDFFEDLSNLRVFDVSSNKIESFHQNLQNTKLEQVYFADNLLEDFPEDSLLHAKDTLQYLDLSRNRIRFLNTSSLLQLGYLKHLILAGNSFLSPDQFLHLQFSNMVSLDLSGNIFEQYDATNASEYSLAPSLESLNLANASLRFIPDIQSSSLISLNVSHNSIQQISANVVQSLANLQELDLSHNLLNEVYKNVWTNFRNLRSLRLGSNPISDFSNYTFTNLKMLRELAIENVTLQRMDRNSFTPLVSLRKLEMDFAPDQQDKLADMLRENNAIKELHLHVRGDKLHDVFKDTIPKSLTVVTLQGNELKEVSERALAKFTGKNFVLDIRETNITYLSDGVFENMKNVRNFTALLSGNMLQSVGRITSEYGTQEANRRLLKLTLDENQLVCDCTFDWLWEWLTEFEYQQNCYENECYDVVLEDMRKTKCYNRQNNSIVDAFKTDLFCSTNGTTGMFKGILLLLVSFCTAMGLY